MKILALSSSRVDSGGFLEWALPLVSQFIGNNQSNIAFVPFASVQKNYKECGDMVQQAFQSLSCSVRTFKISNDCYTVLNSDKNVQVPRLRRDETSDTTKAEPNC
jgi:peptidase E